MPQGQELSGLVSTELVWGMRPYDGLRLETRLCRDLDVRCKVRTLLWGNRELLNVWGPGAEIPLQDEQRRCVVQDGCEEGKARSLKT